MNTCRFREGDIVRAAKGSILKEYKDGEGVVMHIRCSRGKHHVYVHWQGENPSLITCYFEKHLRLYRRPKIK